MSLRRLMASPSDPVRVVVPGPEPKFLDFCLFCYTMLLNRSLLIAFIFLLYILVLALNAHIKLVQGLAPELDFMLQWLTFIEEEMLRI